MSESSTEGQSTTEGQETNQEQEGAGATSDTTDWKAEARKWEQRAKANTEAAERLQALEDAQKSEAQKQQDALAAATAERDQLRLDLMRRDVAAKVGLPPEMAARLQGSTVEELETDAKTLAPLIAARQEEERKQAFHDSSAGKPGGAATTPADAFAQVVDKYL